MILRRIVFSVLVWSLLLVSSSWSAEPAALWEFAPYRVGWRINFGGAIADESRVRSEIAAYLDSASAIDFGPAWVVAPVSGTPAELDKLYEIDLRSNERRWQVVIRELDQRTRQHGPVVARRDIDLRLLASTVWRGVREAFRPLLLVDEVNGVEVRLRLRAGGLVAEPEHRVRPQVGQVLQPWLRSESRRGDSRAAEPRIAGVEWTWLVVKSAVGSEITAEAASGYRTPLSGRARGQVQTYALLIQPAASVTQLTLTTPRDAKAKGDSATTRPLAGYEVLSQPAHGTTNRSLGLTDWRGMIALQPSKPELQWLVVRHGGEVLARVPYLPGAERELRLEVPDDNRRLEVEGLTIGLQEQVVDLVAKRQTVLALARADIDTKKFDEAEQRLKQMRLSSSVELLRNELRLQRQRLQADDPRVQAKIKRLFDDCEQVLNTHLDSREIDQVERELKVQRSKK